MRPISQWEKTMKKLAEEVKSDQPLRIFGNVFLKMLLRGRVLRPNEDG